jgi:hypothetical protein
LKCFETENFEERHIIADGLTVTLSIASSDLAGGEVELKSSETENSEERTMIADEWNNSVSLGANETMIGKDTCVRDRTMRAEAAFGIDGLNEMERNQEKKSIVSVTKKTCDSLYERECDYVSVALNADQSG